MNYYERHIGDYLKDTAHLSLLEHGVYTRLMDVYYTRETGIPASDVARLIGARTKEERAALDAVLGEFFRLADGVLLQDRCDREIDRFRGKQAKAKASADARWNAQRSQSERNADAMRTHSEGNTPRARPQTPVTSNQEKNKPAPPTSETVVRVDPDDPPATTPTPAGAVCRSLRAVGIANVNPGHALLAALLEAGATEAEFVGAAPDAKDKRDPFAYVLGVVKGQREDAAKAAQSLLTGPLPTSPPPSALTVQSKAAEQTAALLRADQEHRAEVARQREQRRLAEQEKAA